MKEFSLEIESKVKSAIDSVEYPFNDEDGLIHNNDSISLSSAQEYNPLLLFRWKLRECSMCGITFDISTNGFLYKCGECV